MKSYLTKNKLSLLLFFIIFIVGIYLRVMAISYTQVDNPIRADAGDYFSYTTNLHKWGVYSKKFQASAEPKPDALRSPGFSIFNYFLYSEKNDIFIQNSIKGQTLFQVIAFLILSLTLYIFYNSIIFLVSIFFLWTFPHFITINTYFLTESLFTSLIAISIVLFVWIDKGEKFTMLKAAVLGLVIGWAILTRPTLQYFPLLLLMFFVFAEKKISKKSFLIFVCSIIPLIVWGIRNLIAIGQWSDSTLMINGLYHGSFPMFMLNGDPTTFGFPYRFDPDAQKVYEGVGVTLKIIYEKFIVSPLSYVQWYLVGKQFFFWQWDIIAGQGDVFIYPTITSPYYGDDMAILTHRIHRMIHLAWLVVAFIGLFKFLRNIFIEKDALIIITCLLMLYAILIHVIVAPFPRYGIPFKIPALIIFSLALQNFLLWIKKKFV